MNVRTLGSMIVGIFLLAGTGCAVDSADPLLYDDDGNVRPNVAAEEIDEAGIVESCSDLVIDGFQLDSTVRVPVIGGDDVVLVGVGGLALCVDEAGDGDSSDKDGEDSEADGQSSDPQLRAAHSTGGDDDSSDSTSTGPGVPHELLHHGHHGETQPLPNIMADPTPEPSGD